MTALLLTRFPAGVTCPRSRQLQSFVAGRMISAAGALRLRRRAARRTMPAPSTPTDMTHHSAEAVAHIRFAARVTSPTPILIACLCRSRTAAT